MQDMSAGLLVFLAASQTLYLGAAIVLGLRLLQRARRERQLPELLLGLHFALCLALGYALLGGGLAALEDGLLPLRATAWMIGVGQLASGLGVLANVAFTWRVFRPDAGWAAALTVALGAALLGGHAGYGLTGGFETGRFTGFWFWLHYGALVGAGAWAAIESLAYWWRMRKRRALGLADPLVTNRFWLWGVGSLARLAMVCAGFATPVARGLGDAERQALEAVVFSATSALGVGVSVCFWLTFFPPRAYERFVLRGSAGAGR